METKAKRAWICPLLLAFSQATLPVCALDIDALPYPLRSKPTKPIQVDRKSRTLEDVVDRAEVPYSFPQMVPLQGIGISGLGANGAQALGLNYFVVAANTKVTRMSDIYKENRLAGKANYVTIDSVLHPYIAFSNRVHADMIRRNFIPLTRSLLISMMQICAADYKQAEDNDVRADILCNMSFLGVSLRLIDPAFKVPPLGNLPQMVQADLDAIAAEKSGHSATYDKDEDFSVYRPLGWYASSPDLVAFFKLKTWMSRLAYPVNDIDFSSGGARANNFRRSVLMYRALDLSEVDGKPGYDSWAKLVKAWFMLGSQVESWNEKNLYCHDYRTVFKTNSADLRITLGALAEPLYRTKLMLAVRRQKPVSLSTASIFDIEDQGGGKESQAAFRLMPTVGNPEEPWLRSIANRYPESLNDSLIPVSLMMLNGRSSARAGNTLLDTSWALDPTAADLVADLKTRVMKRLPGGQLQPTDHKLWTLVTPLFRLPPDGVQTVLRSETWASRRMESAIAAWVDAQCSISPPLTAKAAPTTTGRAAYSPAGTMTPVEKQHLQGADSGSSSTNSTVPLAAERASYSQTLTSPANGSCAQSERTTTRNRPELHLDRSNGKLRPTGSGKGGTGTATGSGAGSSTSSASPTGNTAAKHSPSHTAEVTIHRSQDPVRRVRPTVARRIARGHYVDPCPEIFQKLASDALSLEKEATALGFTIGPHKARLDDFVRLFQRLERIATDELMGKSLSPADLNLLSGIDSILEKVDLPLPAVLSFSSSPTASNSAASSSGGFNLALGRPGHLYVILQNKATTEWTLARGAVYTFYELPGAPLTVEGLLSKIDTAKIKPPYWAEKFDLIQTDVKRGAAAASDK
ncbi:MAG: DUF3160 domain-containing protein [Candidatus Obscuribacterales bacterium]|nr:DUF3160 domain-containing protein [Candidatus Obscuribacterales bacterium]